jgi:tight adherence protein B
MILSSTPQLKFVGLALAWVGTAAFIYASSVHPRGLLRRAGSRYVAGLDADFRAMYLPQRGSELAWLQVVVVVGCIATHAMTRLHPVLVLAALAALLPRALLTTSLKKRRARIDAQVNGFALALSSTLKTTASVGDALRYTTEITAKPLRQEIETALREVRVGSTVEEALLATAGRAGAPAFDVLVSALLIGHKTGGDLPKILEGTAASLRELKRLEELTDRVTREAKQSFGLAAAIVLTMGIMLPRMMPTVFEPMFHSTKGQLVLVQCAAAYLVALFLGWRFLRKSI